jgi:hypothetical protein
MDFVNAGSDKFIVEIYRGSGSGVNTLVGYTPITTINTSGYMTALLTVQALQSLTFTVGQQVVVLFKMRGSTSTFAYYLSSISDINIAWTVDSPNPLTTGDIIMPSKLVATNIRVCIDFI